MSVCSLSIASLAAALRESSAMAAVSASPRSFLADTRASRPTMRFSSAASSIACFDDEAGDAAAMLSDASGAISSAGFVPTGAGDQGRAVQAVSPRFSRRRAALCSRTEKRERAGSAARPRPVACLAAVWASPQFWAAGHLSVD